MISVPVQASSVHIVPREQHTILTAIYPIEEVVVLEFNGHLAKRLPLSGEAACLVPINFGITHRLPQRNVRGDGYLAALNQVCLLQGELAVRMGLIQGWSQARLMQCANRSALLTRRLNLKFRKPAERGTVFELGMTLLSWEDRSTMTKIRFAFEGPVRGQIEFAALES